MAKKCFLDEGRWCDATCMAYTSVVDADLSATCTFVSAAMLIGLQATMSSQEKFAEWEVEDETHGDLGVFMKDKLLGMVRAARAKKEQEKAAK